MAFRKTAIILFKIDVFAKAIYLLWFIFMNQLFNKERKILLLGMAGGGKFCFHGSYIF